MSLLLNENDKYQECETSGALEGLPIALLSETLKMLTQGNENAAMWFAQKIKRL